MEMHKKILKSSEFEDVLLLLRHPPCDDFSVILTLWDKEWLSEEEVDKWCRKAQVSFKKNPKRKVTLYCLGNENACKYALCIFLLYPQQSVLDK